MRMTLSPAGGTLTSGFDKDGPVMGTITAGGYHEFTGWDWSLSPDPAGRITVSESGASLKAGWAAPLLGLFPLEEIAYIIPGTLASQATARRWGDVPAGVDVVRFRPHPGGVRRYTLSVTAHGTIMPAASSDPLAPAPEPEPASVSGSFVIEIAHHYDANRDALKERINASSGT